MATILLVNPDSVQAWFYQQELEDRGFIVHVATTTPQALSLLKAVKPNLIILDSGPPGSAGVHSLAKRLSHVADAPVILNASAMCVDEEVCRQHGWEPAARVLKSSDTSSLVSAISRLLQGSRPNADARY